MPSKKNQSASGHKHALWRWLDDFSACVRARDYAAARTLFVRDTHGFGTVVKASDTRARLERMQWAKVWPATSGFRFGRAGARMSISADKSLAVVMVTWKACNHPLPKRLVFDRHGRATLVLRRTGTGVPWLAEHTHFSFNPGSVCEKSGGS